MNIKVEVENFKNINHFLKTIDSREVNQVFKNTSLASESDDYKFTGTKDYKEAEMLLENGWDEHLEKIKKGVMNNLKIIGNKSTTKMKLDFVGYSPCVPRAIQGLPDSMYNSRRTTKKAPVISIIYDIGVSAKVKTEEIIRYGINILSLINLIEASGVKVKLDLCLAICSSFKGKKYDEEICSYRINVKDYKDSLDLKKLAFPLIHPSMLRRLSFKYMERSPNLVSKSFKFGYGTPIYTLGYSNSDVEIMQSFKNAALKKGEYYINSKHIKELNEIDDIKAFSKEVFNI